MLRWVWWSRVVDDSAKANVCEGLASSAEIVVSDSLYQCLTNGESDFSANVAFNALPQHEVRRTTYRCTREALTGSRLIWPSRIGRLHRLGSTIE